MIIRKFILFIFILIPTFVCAANKIAIFAGGCFWCMEADFDKVNGVIETISGYDGGKIKNPTYPLVSSGKASYAESVKVIYDPNKVSYQELLQIFWKNIDPTVKNAQFCDRGKQYRSAIFYLNEKQKELALASLDKVKKKFQHVFTEVTPSTHFYPAETYHQNYYQNNPIKYKFYRLNCGRDARLKKVWSGKPL